MAGFCFTKHSGKNLSSIFFCLILLDFVSVLTANNICDQYKHITLKPTSIYTNCNVKINLKLTETAPTIAYPSIANLTSFNLTTIIMLSPKGDNSVHWLRTNISKDLLVIGTSKRANDVFTYKGPSPPEYTGVFHYQFYLLSQSQGSNVSIDPFVNRYRKHFKLAEFQKANQMEILGVFQYRTEYIESSSGRSFLSVILGISSVVSLVFFDA